jgi:hypothetical protein
MGTGGELVGQSSAPYPGTTRLRGDGLKLQSLTCEEQTGVIAIGYEHDPPRVALAPLLGLVWYWASSFAEEKSRNVPTSFTRFINNW